MNKLNKDSEENDNLVPKLVDKISLQALELRDLEFQLSEQKRLNLGESLFNFNDSKSINDTKRVSDNTIQSASTMHERLHSPIDFELQEEYNTASNIYDNFVSTSATTISMANNRRQPSTLINHGSDIAAHKRIERELNHQISSLQQKLIAAEARLVEHSKAKNKLSLELENKVRDIRHLEKACGEKESEIQRLQNKLTVENTPKISTPSRVKTKPSNQRYVNSYSKLAGSKDTVSAEPTLKFQLEKCQHELEKSREEESKLQMKIKVLEDALEFRSEEVGLAGQADLLSKVAKLKGEVFALRCELQDKDKKLCEVEDVKMDLSSRHQVLQKQITLMQQRLAQSQQDSYRLANGVNMRISQPSYNYITIISFRTFVNYLKLQRMNAINY